MLEHRRPAADRQRRARRRQHPRGRQADAVAAALRDVSAVAAVGAVRAAAGGGRSAKSRSWCSSSTRRTCCSTMRRRRCSTRSSRWCGSIRSKGVGVYFVTQNPLDVPDTVLGQLGNRVQHALRAFTPRDQKAVKAAARDDARQSEARHREGDHRARPSARRWSRFSTRKGAPTPVERAFMLPPAQPDRPDHAGRARGR